MNRIKVFISVFGFGCLAASWAGCAETTYLIQMTVPADPDAAERVAPQPYPMGMPIAEPKDIVVVRTGRTIRLLNRTAESYDNATLWLNYQYGARIPSIPIGASSLINLDAFVNQHGEAYPTGWILEPELSRPLTAADLVLESQMHKLSVELEDQWRTD